jgi:hypothetical protein
MQPFTGLDIVTSALFEVGAFGPGDNIPNEDQVWVLKKFQTMVDSLNAQEYAVYAVNYLELTLQANIQPLLLGEGVTITATQLVAGLATYTGSNTYQVGDVVSTAGCTNGAGVFNVLNQIVTGGDGNTYFTTQIGASTVAQAAETAGLAIYATPANTFPNYVLPYSRPFKLADANIILNNVNPIVRVPLRIRDKDWWIANPVPTTPTTLPTDIYYDPRWPNGYLYLWPLQTFAYGLELEILLDLSNLRSLSQQFFMPQGYAEALTNLLAWKILPSYGKKDPVLIALIRDKKDASMGVIMANNSYSPVIATADAGIPRSGRHGTMFNWLSGQVVPGRR